MEAEGEWRRGWPVVLAAASGVGLGYGILLMTAGLFVVPMQAELGWPRTAVMIGPIVGLAAAPLSPLAGMAMDRVGARPIAILGLVILCLAFAAMAVVPISVISFYGILAVFSVACTISGPMIYCKGVATWFRRHAGLAFGVTMSGVSVSSALGIYIVNYFIQNHGWRSGYLAIAALIATLGVPIVFFLFRERDQIAIDGQGTPPAPRESMREVVKTRQFWMLVLALGFASLPVGGFLSQLYPVLQAGGFSLTLAASAVSAYALTIGIGRVASGLLLDRFYPSLVAACCLSAAGAGAILIALCTPAASPWYLVVVASVLLGWGQGAEADFMAFFTRHLFDVRQFGMIFGCLSLVVGSGIAAGGFLFAAIFDLLHDYSAALFGSALLYFFSALLMFAIPLKRPVVRT